MTNGEKRNMRNDYAGNLWRCNGNNNLFSGSAWKYKGKKHWRNLPVGTGVSRNDIAGSPFHLERIRSFVSTSVRPTRSDLGTSQSSYRYINRQ